MDESFESPKNIPQEKRSTKPDAFQGQEPQRLGVNVPTQDNQGTKNLQEDMFDEVGKELEGFKDSHLDKEKS
jgi:hypothetical protein